MPWKASCAMDERMRFVVESELGEYSMAELCRRYGISRTCGYKWLERFAQDGAAGLEDQSRAPRRCPHRVGEATEAALVAFRREHPLWGPRKLLARLERDFPQRNWPAPSTVGDILKRHGLTVPRRRRGRATPTAQPFGSCVSPNAVWCADFKGWFRTADGMRCDPFTLTDACSRYVLRCQVCAAPGYGSVRGIMEACFREYGLPDAIRTDNGPPFASTGLGGLSRLNIWWIRLGIDPQRIRPGHPQENGRHERFHRTLKDHTLCPPAATVRAQQRVFDAFRREYNEDRPHEALGQRPPAQVYRPARRSYPSRVPVPDYGEQLLVRRVEEGGRAWCCGERIFLSKVLHGQWVGFAPVDRRYWLVYFGPQLLGVVDGKRRRVLRVDQARRRIPDVDAAIKSCTTTANPSPGGGMEKETSLPFSKP